MVGYVASSAISLGPIFWLLIAEIYPLKIRGLAEGTAATFNWASNPLSRFRVVAQFRHKYALDCALRGKMQINQFARIAQNHAV